MIRLILKSAYQLIYRFFSSPPPNIYLALRYPQYRIGRGTYGDLSIKSWGSSAVLTIGAYTSIAEGVKIFLGGEHRPDWVTTYPFNVLWESAQHYSGHPSTKGDVVIGNDVWIGTEALILSGVTIGDGAVIGAGAIVARDVPPYAIVVGNPSQIIKYRFDPKTIQRLLAINWWEWPDSIIDKAMTDMLNDNIEGFLVKAEQGEYQ